MKTTLTEQQKQSLEILQAHNRFVNEFKTGSYEGRTMPTEADRKPMINKAESNHPKMTINDLFNL